jgi:hypothetical protein
MALPDGMTNWSGVTLPYNVQTTDLQPYTDNINYLATGLGSYGLYTGTSTSLTTSASWNAIPFATTVTASNGITVGGSGTSFTLATGVWTVGMGALSGSGALTGGITSSNTDPDHVGAASVLAYGGGALTAGVSAVALNIQVLSSGSTVLYFWIYSSTAQSLTTTKMLPHVTFYRNPN